jgi:RNA polymerase sigma-70 factor (ECF subfamily)
MDDPTAMTRRLIDRVHREEYPRIVASTARLTGDLGMAEDAVQDAFGAAIANWSRSGPPDNPGAWLTTVARNRAIDALRREGRRDELEAASGSPPSPPLAAGAVVDDQLRLMFVTCHPSLSADTRVALTLKFVCGLRTPEIARVLLVGEDAVTKRIQRARRKIRDARIPMQIPPRERLGERVRWVLECLYLVFTEGYAATVGEQVVRAELCTEAIRLTRLVDAMDPNDPAPGCPTRDPDRRRRTPDPARGSGPRSVGPRADRGGARGPRVGAAGAGPHGVGAVLPAAGAHRCRARRRADVGADRLVEHLRRLRGAAPADRIAGGGDEPSGRDVDARRSRSRTGAARLDRRR